MIKKDLGLPLRKAAYDLLISLTLNARDKIDVDKVV